MFSWKKFEKPVLGLAPMADHTDSPFSLMCKKFGADVIYREMVSADAIVHNNDKTLKMAEFDPRERPIILQIFGKDPAVLAEAARILEEKFNPDGIDINMGCPARKIVGDFNGASLMREPRLAAKIIKEVKKSVRLQVSVKTRTGWERDTEILDFSKIIEDAGADALAIHGRTKKQGYSGAANWEIIGQVKNNLKIPVILNGDIVDFASFRKALEASGADGALIGRGALGHPWVFKQIKTKGKFQIKESEKIKTALEHFKKHYKFYGERGVITFRKHLAFYFKGMQGAKKKREQLASMSTFREIENFLSN